MQGQARASAWVAAGQLQEGGNTHQLLRLWQGDNGALQTNTGQTGILPGVFSGVQEVISR
jgi:hypothetical protein